MKKSPFYLVDASIYIFRAWFSMPDSITNEQGHSINAVYGYLLFVSKLLAQLKQPQIAFAFDESLDSCFRNKIYPLYKSSRGLPDENLAFQLKACRQLTQSLGLSCYSSKRYEADDLIGSLAEQYRSEVSKVIIVTRDKDLGQLLKKKDELWDFAANEKLNVKSFESKFQVKPHQFVDYLALVGDPVDDIPGVYGLGPKAAITLLEKFSDLEGIYSNIDQIESLGIRGAASLKSRLIEHKQMAMISYKLARIHCALRLSNNLLEHKWQGLDQKKFERSLNRLGVKGRSRTSLNNAFNNLTQN